MNRLLFTFISIITLFLVSYLILGQTSYEKEGFTFLTDITWNQMGNFYVSGRCNDILKNEGDQAFLDRCTDNKNNLNNGSYQLSNGTEAYMTEDENYTMNDAPEPTPIPDIVGNKEYNGLKYNWVQSSDTQANSSPFCKGIIDAANKKKDIMVYMNTRCSLAPIFPPNEGNYFELLKIKQPNIKIVKTSNNLTWETSPKILPDGSTGIMTDEEYMNEYYRQISPKIIKGAPALVRPNVPLPIAKSTSKPITLLNASDMNLGPQWLQNLKKNIKCNKPITNDIMTDKIKILNKTIDFQKNELSFLESQMSDIESRIPIIFRIGNVSISDTNMVNPVITITGQIPDPTLNFIINRPQGGIRGQKGDMGDQGPRGSAGSSSDVKGNNGYWGTIGMEQNNIQSSGSSNIQFPFEV